MMRLLCSRCAFLEDTANEGRIQPHPAGNRHFLSFSRIRGKER